MALTIKANSFGEGLFNSCKDVKFGTMNTRAIEFIGAGAKNFKGDYWMRLSIRTPIICYRVTLTCY